MTNKQYTVISCLCFGILMKLRIMEIKAENGDGIEISLILFWLSLVVAIYNMATIDNR